MTVIYRIASAIALISFFALVGLTAEIHLLRWSFLWIVVQALFASVFVASVSEMIETTAAHLNFLPFSGWKSFFTGFAVSAVIIVVVSLAFAGLFSPVIFDAFPISTRAH